MIPTAEEFARNIQQKYSIYCSPEELGEGLIEFAKLHVKAALRSASYKAKIKGRVFVGRRASEETQIDTDSIINAYSLENIK